MTADAPVHARRYLVVFGALMLLTAVTVAVSYVPMPAALTIAMGLSIAMAKASLVALFFMHLINERRVIYLTLTFTAVFCVALFALTLWTEADHVPGTQFTHSFDSGERSR
jgi:cytochrome c oxidase subunit 4